MFAQIRDQIKKWLEKLLAVWSRVHEALRAVEPCRLALVVVILVPIVFIKVEQASEVLRLLAEGPSQTGGANTFQSLMLLAGLVAVCLYAWYFSRVLLYMQFPDSPPLTELKGLRLHLPRIIGLMPALGLAIAFFLASRVYTTSSTPEVGRVLQLYSGVCLLTAIALYIFFVARRYLMTRNESDAKPTHATHLQKLPSGTKWAIRGLLVAAIGLFVGFVVWPVGFAQNIGCGAVILLAAACWICFGSWVVYLAHKYQAPLVTVLLLLAALFSLWNDNHKVRTLPGPIPATPPTLTEYYQTWYSNLHARFPSEQHHPVYIISAEGGGIRAAFWTATVLARLQDSDTNFAAHVLAISGVSGGSLGATVFDALVAEGTVSNYTANAQGVLSHDFLSPTLAYMLFPDLLQRFLPFPVHCFDRAGALEMAWERGWRSEMKNDRFTNSFRSLWMGDRRHEVPALFLNGTSVETGKRMIASNVQIDGTFVDSLDVSERLDGEIRLSTAAHMSARFTYVSPAGLFTNGEHIVDGGYFENSGTATASDILDVVTAANGQFQAKALPIVIIISNNPEKSGGNKKQNREHHFLSEVLYPLQSLLHTREARGSYSELALAFQQGYTNVVTFGLEPGNTPLPLGWSLSQGAIVEMNRQMAAQEPELRKVLQHLPGRNSFSKTFSGPPSAP